MSQRITLELPDATYRALETAAQSVGQAPAQWLLTHLQKELLTSSNGAASVNAGTPSARSVESYFGAINSGDPSGADNERIDADLADEYGRGLQ